MKNWFSIEAQTVLGIFITILLVYITIITLTRIFGKRSFSKMSGFDFPMTIAVGSIIAATILSPTPSLLQGMFGLFFVFALQLTAGYLRRFKSFANLIDNAPLLLMDGSKILDENLLKARVTETDLRSKLREANVSKLSQVKAVIFEATGDISVLHSDSDDEIDSWIMEDVMPN